MFFLALFKTELISAHILIFIRLLIHFCFLTGDNYLLSADFINVLFTVIHNLVKSVLPSLIASEETQNDEQYQQIQNTDDH